MDIKLHKQTASITDGELAHQYGVATETICAGGTVTISMTGHTRVTTC